MPRIVRLLPLDSLFFYFSGPYRDDASTSLSCAHDGFTKKLGRKTTTFVAVAVPHGQPDLKGKYLNCL